MQYPLFFTPIHKERLWGGRELAKKYNRVLDHDQIGESWEISSHENGMSVICNGPLRGISLAQAIETYGEELLGKAIYQGDYQKFPLLIKILDAADWLSVQVHPADSYAKIHENGELGKTEMWYIIDAKPGAKLVYGIGKGIDKQSLQHSVDEGRLEECLEMIEVKAGDVLYIPAGIVHAIGEGILLCEIQQNSDTTYRVYDWNRVDNNGQKRELHIKKALEVIDFNAEEGGIIDGLTVDEPGGQRTLYVACDYFAVEKLEVQGKMPIVMDGRRFQTLTCIEGQGIIEFRGGQEELSAGASCFLPASLTKVNISGDCTIIRSYVPDKEENIIKPMLKRGYTRKQLQVIAGMAEG